MQTGLDMIELGYVGLFLQGGFHTATFHEPSPLSQVQGLLHVKVCSTGYVIMVLLQGFRQGNVQ